MRDPDLDRRVTDEFLRWVDRVGRSVVAPDVEHIHRRAETRTVRGIAITFAGTAVAGLVLGAVVIGVGGIGMRDGQPAGRVAARPVATAAHAIPSHLPPTTPVAGPGGRGAAASASAPAGRPPASSAPVTTSDALPSPGPSREPSPEPTRSAARSTPTVPAARSTPTVPEVRSSATPTADPPTTAPTADPPTTAPTADPPTVTPMPSAPTPRSQMSATAVGRPPLALRPAFRSGARDARGCRPTRQVDRTLYAPTPRSVVRAVLDGPTAAERGRGVGSVYGRGGRTTPATIAVDWGRRLVTVDLESLSSVGVSPTTCRAREIRGPVLDALRQYNPRWSVRFTVRGDPAAFSHYLNGP